VSIDIVATEPLLYPSDTDLPQVEAQSDPSPTQLAELAWGLRQRDTTRAVVLAQRAEALLQPQAQPRLWLVRAEAALMVLDFESALALQQQALQCFAVVGDELGCADAHWLASSIASDRGDVDGVRSSALAALACAERAGDAARMLFLKSALGRAEAFRDITAARREWAGKLPADTSSLDAGTAAAVEDLRGLLAGMGSDFLPAVRAMNHAYELSQRSGQLRRAIALASNLGRAYWGISDFEAAMAWLTRGLALARRAGWPASIALCQAQLGETLRRLGRIGEARAALQEALQLMAGQPVSRTVLLALNYLAHTEQDDGRGVAALQAFEALLERAREADAKDLKIDAQLGRAQALLSLGWPVEARVAAMAGLALAAGQADKTVDLQWVLGDIALVEPGSPTEALRFYRLALDAAYAVQAFVPPPRLMEACARAHAALGEFERAYQFSLRASELRQQHFTAEASQRSLARHAASEAARLEALRGTQELLLQLGEIGREITAELDSERVLAALERHVHALLSVDSMAVYQLDDAGEQLICVFGMEEGQAFADPPIPLDSPHSYVALSAREGRELRLAGAQPPEYGVPGSSEMQSVLFGPLRVAERVTGVMTVQALRLDAYGEREALVFRSLCAYAAIALENARVCQRLRELQQRMMAQEKLAALGAMMTGVADELETPIGNSLLIANTLLGSTRGFAEKLAGQALRRSDEQHFALQMIEGLQVLERDMASASALVRSFKQVSVDRSSE